MINPPDRTIQQEITGPVNDPGYQVVQIIKAVTLLVLAIGLIIYSENFPSASLAVYLLIDRIKL